MDLTSELTSYGAVIPATRRVRLVVHPTAAARRSPSRSTRLGNRSETVIAGSLGTDGVFSGTMTARTAGSLQYRMRSAFYSRLTATQRRDLGRTLAQGLFDGASADSLEIFDGRDLRATPRTRVWVSGGRAASRSGETLILTYRWGTGRTTSWWRSSRRRRSRGASPSTWAR